MVDRISSAALHQQSLSQMSAKMAEVNKLNVQISSGRRANSFSELNGGVNRIISYQGKLNKIDNYLSNNKAAITRLQTANTAVSTVQKIAEDYRAMLVQWKTDGNERGNAFVQQAKGYLDQIAGQLNVSVEGRYIFSGTRTDTAPIAEHIPDPTVFGVGDDNYYQGDDNELLVQASDTYEVSYGVRANEQAFQDLISSIKTAINADATGTRGNFDKALDLATSSVEDLTSVAARVNSNIVSIENVNNQHTDIQVYLKNALGDEVDTDITAATTQLSVDSAILQATYAAFARISNLRLNDYLK